MRLSTRLATFTSGFIFFALVFRVATVSVCERFYFVPGYDRCGAPNFLLGLVFFMLAAVLGFLLPRNQAPSSVVVWGVYIMHVFGSIALYPYFVSDINLEGLAYSFFVLLSFGLAAQMVKWISIDLRFIKVQRKLVYVILVGASLLLLSNLIISFGLNFQFASIYDVYEVRDGFEEMIRSSDSRIVSYSIILTAFLFAPLMVLTGIHELKRSLGTSVFMILLGLLSTSQVFALAAFKSSVAIIFISLVISVTIGRMNRPLDGFFLTMFVVILFLLILHLFKLNGSAIDHWFRRVFIGPGVNVIFFFETFGWFNFGDGASAPLEVSRTFYNTSGSANSGLFGNGFAKGGVIGVFANLAIFCGFCVCLDSVSRFCPREISFPLAFVISYAFSNSASTTVLLSYGGVFLLMALYLLSSSYKRTD